MAKHTRMSPLQFAEWIKMNLKHGEYVAFALDENGHKVSSDETIARGNADLECWWCATIIKSEDYDFNVLLINHAGGGQPYAIEIDYEFAETLEYYFAHLNDSYDNDHQIVVETRYKAKAQIMSAVKSAGIFCFAYSHEIEAAKKAAMERLTHICKSGTFPIGECAVNLTVEQDGEYVDADEAMAMWDGNEIKIDWGTVV